jgi:tetratricopeptide (TPR) repeat protein
MRSPSMLRPRAELAAWALGSILCLLVSMLVVGGAHAGGASGPSKIEAIRTRMEQGQALFAAGSLREAAKVFDDGYQAYPYSAFLFNAGVCYQKLAERDRALDRFRQYLRVDPAAPDAARVRERIVRLEAELGKSTSLDAALEAGEEAGAEPTDAATPEAGPVEEIGNMKSLVLIETNPDGAPLVLYSRAGESTGPFVIGGDNPGYTRLLETHAPANLTLDVGRYHVVVEKFRGYNESQADIDVVAGKVLVFKANLSQGQFMAFLRVSANVRGAYAYLDDPEKQKPEWGVVPHGELVAAGTHRVLVEAPGFEPVTRDVVLAPGDQKELELTLARVGYGYLRVDANAPEIVIQLDGIPAGSWRSGEPPLELKLPSGPKELVVKASGRKTLRVTVNVPKGQVLPVHALLIATYPRGVAWTQAIIGGVLVGAAIWTGVESNRVYHQLESDRHRGVLVADDDRVLKGRLLAIGADAGFVLGGVLGALATYNFVKDPLPESSVRNQRPREFPDPKRQRPTAEGGETRIGLALGARGVMLGGSF